jgi:hypothetical protein
MLISRISRRISGGHNWPAATAPRLPAPIRPKTRTMPADNGVRLNDRQSIANSREQPIETNEYQSVDGTEGDFLWSSPPQNVYLLPQGPNLCLEDCPRPEQIDDHPTNKSAKIPHPTRGLPDSRSPVSRIGLRQGHPVMNSQATSVTSLKPYQSAISTCFAFSRENCHPEILDFCNNICHLRPTHRKKKNRQCGTFTSFGLL